MNIIEAAERFKPRPKITISLFSILIKDPDFARVQAQIQEFKGLLKYSTKK